MKKISLKWDIYKKFYEISDKIFANLDKDIALVNMATNFKKIVEITMKGWLAWEDEAYWRSMHYCVLDNIWVISNYLDNSKEVWYLKNTIIWVFEILRIDKEKVIFLDVSNWKEYEIIWEWEWSESSLEIDFKNWDLIISRLIKLDDWWYNMKTFYFIKQDSLQENDFENLKIWYKQIFVWIRDMLDLEERMEQLNKVTQDIDDNWINYLKRIKQILLKPLGKKRFKLLEKILKKADEKSFSEVFYIIGQTNISKDDVEKLKKYVVSYLNESIWKIWEKKYQETNKRLQLTINSFFEYLKINWREIRTDKKMHENEIKEVEQMKIHWFNTKNALFSNKTPLDFIHEIDPEYDISNLRMTKVDPEEQEFYDWYEKFFTEDENEIYKQALKDSIDLKYEKARTWYKKLLKEHFWFFRLRWNYLSVSINSIMDKYEKVKDNSFVKKISLEELEEDWTMLLNVDNELKELDRLKKWYTIKWSDNFSQIKSSFSPLLRHLIFLKRKSLINDLVKKDDELTLLSKIKDIIPDFEISEFIKKVREENTLFIDYIWRIKEWLWYKEDDMYEIFHYFWNKYKNKDDFIDDHIKKIYNDIWIRKIKPEWLKNFINFIFKNKKQINSSKSCIIDYFDELIDSWEITLPINIINFIDDEKNKKDFIKCMNILEVEDMYLV